MRNLSLCFGAPPSPNEADRLGVAKISSEMDQVIVGSLILGGAIGSSIMFGTRQKPYVSRRVEVYDHLSHIFSTPIVNLADFKGLCENLEDIVKAKANLPRSK